jgi:GR25 family glycosyltransferase involved in LPS biosynthesis
VFQIYSTIRYGILHLFLTFLQEMELTFQEFQQKGGVILSLPRYEYRFQHTRHHLQQVGFQNIQFYKGIDGFVDDLSGIAIQLGIPGIYTEDIAHRPGNIACTLSHISLWKKIIDDSLPYLLIFEDDALPHPNFGEVGPLWWDQTPGDLDMILLGNQMNPTLQELYDPTKLIVRHPAYCLHAYIVTQKGAQKLMQLVKSQSAMKMNDAQVMDWMSQGLLNFVCWNGAWIQNKGYDTFTQRTPLQAALDKMDMIVEKRDTGLIYQNFCLGHTLYQKDPIFNIVLYNSEQKSSE